MADIDMIFPLPYPAGQAYEYAVELYDDYEQDVSVQVTQALVCSSLNALINRVEISLDAPVVEVSFDTELSADEVLARINNDPALSLLELHVWGE